MLDEHGILPEELFTRGYVVDVLLHVVVRLHLLGRIASEEDQGEGRREYRSRLGNWDWV
jgi:hypothetical protein